MSFSSARRSALAAFVFTVVALCSVRAKADDEPAPTSAYVADDVVVMIDGHEIKGHVVFEAARTYLRMWLDDGKVVTIPWSQVDRVILSPAKPNMPGVTILPPPKTDEHWKDDTNDEADETVRVIFDADESTVLEQRSLNNSREWVPVCKGKCTEELLRNVDYRIGGGGARTSAVFRLKGSPGDTVIVTAQTHSRGLFGLGVTLTSVGGLFLLVSADAAGQCSASDCAGSGAAIGIIVGSMIATGVGVALIATNPSSKVTQKFAAVGSVAKPSASLLQPPAVTASLRPRDDAFRSTTPQFAPAAHTSSLFTIHF